MSSSQVRDLRRLARLHGAQVSYYDATGRLRHASPDALMAVLRALGAPLERPDDIPAALLHRRRALWARVAGRVAVAWEGGPAVLLLRLPAASADAAVRCALELETGEVRRWHVDLRGIPAAGAAEVDGVRHVRKRLVLPGGFPWGYHRLRLETRTARGPETVETLVISAPARAWAPPAPARPDWGVFLPLYALWSARSRGGGDLADLEALADWVAGFGGGVVGTLPLLACFLDAPFEPSPYVPASRIFWNELYLDLTRIPELERCPAARARLDAADLRAEMETLRGGPLVDYGRLAAAQRGVLEELARCLFAGDSLRRREFQDFIRSHPPVEDYARFRAACLRQAAPWPAWPERMRGGVLDPGDYDESAARYHAYVQWLAHQQIHALAEAARAKGVQLYFDLPLGVHADGYDVWRRRPLFASGVSGGAPPDAFFVKGQNWGFLPLHPEKIRDDGYAYPGACVRHILAHAGILRIDHVMGLHRQFWIPHGMEAREGVYVRYPAEELYAVITLESHRHRARIVGEDLGTVPAGVREAMVRHNVAGMYVAQFQFPAAPGQAMGSVREDAVASVNTHDTATFAGFWDGLDIDDRLDLGLLDETGAAGVRQHREATRRALVEFLAREGRLQGAAAALHGVPSLDVLRACLAHLAAGPAGLVLVNLEDLWGEPRPQNVPGTWQERPNWRRKAGYAFEEFCRMPEVVETLREMARLRRPDRADGGG
ncbi:MAG: 4-alpha-glucanotransferase [Armatimonadetes bacterium]|nr:4-alpha-glucanotransferase [Armatimonadota bacterium]